MEFYERDFFISRINSKYYSVSVKGKTLRIYNPTAELVYEANNFVKKNWPSDVLDDKEICNFLIEHELWSEEEELSLEITLPENLDKLKIGLFEASFQKSKQALIRKYIEKTRQEQNRLYVKKHSYDYMTRDGLINYMKSLYILKHCARYRGKRVDWSKFDIHHILMSYYKYALPQNIIRELSRTTPWINQWHTLKTNGKIFNSTYLTQDQISLIAWSNFYDSVHESMDCPSDDIIDDDDALDGWAIIQKKKRESDKLKQQVEGKLSDKAKQADDVFLVADNWEDAKKIQGLNEPGAMVVQQSRLRQVKQKGVVREQELSDVKQKVMMERNRAYREAMKG